MSGAVSKTSWEVVVADSLIEHAALSAEMLARAIVEAVAQRGLARIALSGGSTPQAMHQRLASMALPWDKIEVFWVDERAAALSSKRSNFGQAEKDLGLASLPSLRVFRMEADDADLESAARRYEVLLRQHFGIASAVAFDAMVLGVGDDGHTASLFPGTGAVFWDDRLVAAVPAAPELGREARLTLTAPVLKEARLLVVLAAGVGKQATIAAAFSPGSVDEIPSRLLHEARGKVVWVLDRAAYPSG